MNIYRFAIVFLVNFATSNWPFLFELLDKDPSTSQSVLLFGQESGFQKEPMANVVWIDRRF